MTVRALGRSAPRRPCDRGPPRTRPAGPLRGCGSPSPRCWRSGRTRRHQHSGRRHRLFGTPNSFDAGARCRTIRADVRAVATRPLIDLAVVGAHLEGQPLHHQLTDRDAALVARTTTARLPPVRARHRAAQAGPRARRPTTSAGGAAIEVEVWALEPRPRSARSWPRSRRPLAIGTVVLADGTDVSGFVCEPYALDDAPRHHARSGAGGPTSQHRADPRSPARRRPGRPR